MLPPLIREPTDVVLYRTPEGYGASNVPFFDSPRLRICDGASEWGYTGTGPHELAGDILQWFGMPRKEARHWAYELVVEFLAFVPKAGATIPKERIFKVIEEIRNGTRKHPSETGESAGNRLEANQRNYQLFKGDF